MPPQDATNGGDTKSPLVKPDDWLSEEVQLRVHFYTLKHPCSPEQRSPWWLRVFWWPRPTFSHCSVQWGLFVHNMTIKEGAGLHRADEWQEKNPAQLTLVVPVRVDFRTAAELVTRFEHTSVQKWRVFLWWSRLSRRRPVPTTCASLVAAWVVMTGVATPDELFDNLVKSWNVWREKSVGVICRTHQKLISEDQNQSGRTSPNV